MSLCTAFYDLEYGPISFDFITFLVRAMRERDIRKCQKLHVVIVPKEDGLGGFSRNWGHHDEAAARWRLWHIAIGSCPLAGATVTVAASKDQAVRIRDSNEDAGHPNWWPVGKAHFMGPLVDEARKSAQIPRLRATAAARRYVGDWLSDAKSVVTLTLRNNATDPQRNTNDKEWAKFSEWLLSCGYHVVILQDAHDALKTGMAYAELDPDLRLALYERAFMNVCANTGPQELLKFSHAPYLLIGQALTEGWQKHFRQYFHMQPGEQVPWAGERQKMVYRADHFEVLKEEFERALK